jgi:hypothetical protein
MGDKPTLTAALDAALDPAVAGAEQNKAVMAQLWTPIVGPLQENIQTQLDDGAAKAKTAASDAVTAAVTDAVNQAVAAGQVPATAAQAVIDQKVADALPGAEAEALKAVADKAHATVADGSVSVDWADDAQRTYWVDKLVPDIADEIAKGSSEASSGSSDSVSDTSFLNGADAALTRPFMVGFTQAIDVIYWVGFGVLMLAFVLSWFFKAPPLRTRSALQERADDAGFTATGTIRVQS